MTKIQELYESSVRPMVPAERLQLARLILEGLAGIEDRVDVNDQWQEDDIAELAAYSAGYVAQLTETRCCLSHMR